jgi:hypothetical protein
MLGYIMKMNKEMGERQKEGSNVKDKGNSACKGG